MTTPGVWEWTIGVTQYSVQYTPGTEAAPGSLTWEEDVSSWDDERGNGSHDEFTQTRTDFLAEGPRDLPPLEVIEGILAYVQADKPLWLDSFRLQTAASLQHIAEVEDLLQQGVPPDMPVRGRTPFYWAVYHHNLPLAEMLFAAGIDVNRHFPGDEKTILMVLANWATDASWEPLAQRIVAQGAEVEAADRYGETALMAAVTAGERVPGLVGILLAAGANVNARSLHGYTPLWRAAAYRYTPPAIIEQLIKAGADVNTHDKQGWTVLMTAISSEMVEGVWLLLAAGADVQAISTPTGPYEDPRSVLKFALDYANPEIIRQIQEAGAK